MRIFLMISCFIAIILWLSSLFIKNFGYTGPNVVRLGRSEIEIYAIIIINLLTLVGLFTGGMRWRPVFYLLGFFEFGIGLYFLYLSYTPLTYFLASIPAVRGSCFISYASRMGTSSACE